MSREFDEVEDLSIQYLSTSDCIFKEITIKQRKERERRNGHANIECICKMKQVMQLVQPNGL